MFQGQSQRQRSYKKRLSESWFTKAKWTHLALNIAEIHLIDFRVKSQCAYKYSIYSVLAKKRDFNLSPLLYVTKNHNKLFAVLFNDI